MELLYLKTFCKLVETGNYTRTALELDYAQSSITNHIQRLQQLYGGQKLLHRSGNQVIPTPAGEKLLPYARQMLELQQAAHEAIDFSAKSEPVLTIGTIESIALYLLPDLLESFRRQYPQYKVKVILGQETELIQKLNQSNIDLALILDVPFQQSGIDTVSLFKAEMAVVVHKEHPLTMLHHCTAAELAPYPLVMTEEGCTYRSYLLQQISVRCIQPDIRWELTSIEAIKQAVSKQWGAAFLPRFTLQTLTDSDNLSVLPWEENQLELYVQMLMPEQAEDRITYFEEVCSAAYGVFK